MPPFFSMIVTTIATMISRQYFLPSILALALCGCAAADELARDETAASPRSILFVGNSFTYYNNSLHNHYRALVRSASPEDVRPGRVRIMTISGAQLPEHAAGIPAMVASFPWDVVVMHGHSRGPIEEETAEAFRMAARDYAGIIRSHAAEPVLFMTWAYTGDPEMTGLLDEAYTSIGRELGARVVPVGLAFARVTEEKPDIELRIADARHPSMAGTYLAACTFYAEFHGGSPEGIEYTAGLDADVARYLQRVAWETVQEYRARDRR